MNYENKIVLAGACGGPSNVRSGRIVLPADQSTSHRSSSAAVTVALSCATNIVDGLPVDLLLFDRVGTYPLHYEFVNDAFRGGSQS